MTSTAFASDVVPSVTTLFKTVGFGLLGEPFALDICAALDAAEESAR